MTPRKNEKVTKTIEKALIKSQVPRKKKGECQIDEQFQFVRKVSVSMNVVVFMMPTESCLLFHYHKYKYVDN